MLRPFSLAVALIVLAGCGDDGATDDASIDAGPVEVGPTPEDRDADEWENGVDNCPDVFNPEQRDRDGDGFGDACDSCPATPNGGTAGQVGQADCDIEDETEPNDDAGQSLVLPTTDRVLVLRGTLETPTQAIQPVDRYTLMVAGRSAVRVRVARASPSSLIEPLVRVFGGAYAAPRWAQGLFVAERTLYFSEAGTYTIEISDRRGLIEGTPKGSPDYGYALSLRAMNVEARATAIPIIAEPTAIGAGEVLLFDVELIASDRTIISAVTDFVGLAPPIDPIVVLEAADGTVLAENDDFTDETFDARARVSITTPGTYRVVVDQALGFAEEGGEIALTVDQPPDDVELEPNDTPATSSPLVFVGTTFGNIDAPDAQGPDIDWYHFDAIAGQIASIRGLVEPNSSVDPLIAIGTFDGTDFTAMYSNADSSGTSARIDAIFPVAGQYFIAIVDQRNDMEPFVGGPLFNYQILSEPLALQPVSELTASGALTGVISTGGRLIRHLVTVSSTASLSLATSATGNVELQPFMRIYGPGAIGLLGEGLRSANAALPGPGSYIVAVHNANEGMGGVDFSYVIDATF